MWRRALVVVGFAVSVAAGAGASSGVVGIVSGVAGKGVQIRMSEKRTQVIGVDDQTAYMTWATHKPWQQGAAGSRALAIGRCINVDLRAGDANVAKTIWINSDAQGSVFSIRAKTSGSYPRRKDSDDDQERECTTDADRGTGLRGILCLSHAAVAQQTMARDMGMPRGFARLFTADAPAADASVVDAKRASSIEGIVRDPAGATLAGVALTIRNVATAEIQQRTSDASGAFSVKNVIPGSYEITAEKSGFREASATIVLAASQRAQADVRLTLADAADDAASAGTSTPVADTLETQIAQLRGELAKLKALTSSVTAAQQTSAPAAAAPATPPGPDLQTPFAYGDFTLAERLAAQQEGRLRLRRSSRRRCVRYRVHGQIQPTPRPHAWSVRPRASARGEVQVEQVASAAIFTWKTCAAAS